MRRIKWHIIMRDGKTWWCQERSSTAEEDITRRKSERWNAPAMSFLIFSFKTITTEPRKLF